MSGQCLYWAWRQRQVKTTYRVVLVLLADMANDDGVCWPSVGTLAELSGFSESTVFRALSFLASESAGQLIEVLRRRGRQGQQRASLYVLHIERGRSIAELGYRSHKAAAWRAGQPAEIPPEYSLAACDPAHTKPRTSLAESDPAHTKKSQELRASAAEQPVTVTPLEPNTDPQKAEGAYQTPQAVDRLKSESASLPTSTHKARSTDETGLKPVAATIASLYSERPSRGHTDGRRPPAPQGRQGSQVGRDTRQDGERRLRLREACAAAGVRLRADRAAPREHDEHQTSEVDRA